jgi:hypothetical protein
VDRKTQTAPLQLSENSKLRAKKLRKLNSSTNC